VLVIAGLFMLLLGTGALVATGFAAAERLLLGPGCIAAGVLVLVGARLSSRMARAHPQLTVETDSFVLEHAGLLSRPLVVRRDDVAEISVGDFAAHGGRPAGQPAEAAPRGGRPGRPFSASSELLPDISFPIGSSGRRPNVLVVMRRGFALNGIPRRGLSAVAFLVDRSGAYSGPPRGGVINGLLFATPDSDEVRRAFAPWEVLVDEPSEAALERFSPAEAQRRFKRP
jgi:hypothetical protein